jgi:hypothetical protein
LIEINRAPAQAALDSVAATATDAAAVAPGLVRGLVRHHFRRLIYVAYGERTQGVLPEEN